MSLIPRAPLKLTRVPARSLLPSSLYLLCRSSQELHCLVLSVNSQLPSWLAFEGKRCAEFVSFLSVSGPSLALGQSVLIVRADGN